MVGAQGWLLRFQKVPNVTLFVRWPMSTHLRSINQVMFAALLLEMGQMVSI